MTNNPQQTGVVNVSELNSAAQETLIHIDLTKTFYTIAPPELDILEDGANSVWKDITLSCLGVGIPCGINAIIEYNKDSIFNSEVFWNSLVGGVCLVVSIIFGIIWVRSTNKCKLLIKDIKQRPKYKMP